MVDVYLSTVSHSVAVTVCKQGIGVVDIDLVTVTNQCGQSSDTITVRDLDCSCTYYVPNSFTPDGSEFNEDFGMIYDCDLTDFILRIFNRWGEIIFESYAPNEFWDGTYQNKLVPTGIYTYTIEFKTNNEVEKSFVGHVNVLY